MRKVRGWYMLPELIASDKLQNRAAVVNLIQAHFNNKQGFILRFIKNGREIKSSY